MKTVNYSYRSLRQMVGVLGICLPFMLAIAISGPLKQSISYYYYTEMSTVLTGILIAFGLILFTYRRGTAEDKGWLSENRLTNAGGVFILLVALVPTKYEGDTESLLYMHKGGIRHCIHVASAVLFIFSMGLMVLLKFSKAKYYQTLYKILGSLVMLGLAFTIFAFVYQKDQNQQLFNGAIFWGESFSMFFFGIAWLRRGIPKA
jgi:hypothetical protein